VKFARKSTVTCSLASRNSFIGRSKWLLVPTSAGEIHVEPGAIPDLRYHILALEDGKMKGGMEKFVRDMCHSRPVHQQDRAALVVELPSAIEDNALNIRDVCSGSGVDVQTPHFKRVNLIMIHLGCLNGMVLVGDLCDVRVGIYVALDNQRPRLLVDNAEITGAEVSGRVPIWPPCGRTLN
jgi:hypothetical protein